MQESSKRKYADSMFTLGPIEIRTKSQTRAISRIFLNRFDWYYSLFAIISVVFKFWWSHLGVIARHFWNFKDIFISSVTFSVCNKQILLAHVFQNLIDQTWESRLLIQKKGIQIICLGANWDLKSVDICTMSQLCVN